MSENPAFCAHCGGSVDAYGKAMGGEVPDEMESNFDVHSPEEEKSESPQEQATERMRAAAFGDAMKRRGGR